MCKPIENIDRNCSFVLSGVKEIHLTDYKEDLNYSLLDDDLLINEELDFISLECDLSTSSFSYDVSNTVNGFLSNISITCSFEKIESVKHNKLKKLINKRFFVLIKDFNNNHWFIGLDNGVKLSNINATTGVKREYNGFNITLVSTSSNLYNISPIVYDGEFDDSFSFDFYTA